MHTGTNSGVPAAHLKGVRQLHQCSMKQKGGTVAILAQGILRSAHSPPAAVFSDDVDLSYQFEVRRAHAWHSKMNVVRAQRDRYSISHVRRTVARGSCSVSARSPRAAGLQA